MPLNAAQIRQKSKAAIRTVDVDVPQFGDTIRLRQMTGGELVDYQGFVAKNEAAGTDGDNVFAIIQRCAVDEEGNPLWPGEEGIADIRALPGDVLVLLSTEAGKLHEISDATVERAGKN